MSNEDIADALGTSFIEDESLNELHDIDLNTPESTDCSPIVVDSTMIAVSAVPDDYDSEESLYVRRKLRTIAEKGEIFFDMITSEFRQAPTAKMAESAGKLLDTQVAALGKLVDIDENRKKRKGRNQTPAMQAGGNINVTQNIISNREDLLKIIKENKTIDVEAEPIT